MVKSWCFSQFKLLSKDFELINDIHSQANLVTRSIDSMILFTIYKLSCNQADYLDQVTTNKCFRIDAQSVRFGQTLRPISKEEFIYEIKKQINNISLGFTDCNLPDKAWAINILKTFEHKHQLSLNPKLYEESGLTQDDLAAIQKLDKSLGNNKRLRYFRRTKEQVKAKKDNEQIKKESRKQRIKVKNC